MSNTKVLAIVEGAKNETALMQSLFNAYGLADKYELVVYGTNVHDLIKKMLSYGNDLCDVDLLGVLREVLDDENKDKLNNQYTDILLVFDFDPQDNRFSEDDLRVLQREFNESTDKGKLYINYPMVEACKHFKKPVDFDYIYRTANRNVIEGKSNNSYKSMVSVEGCYSNFKRDYSKEVFNRVIGLTYLKSQFILKGLRDAFEAASKYEELDGPMILEKQIESYRCSDDVLVLGLSVMYAYDYSPSMVNFDDTIESLREYAVVNGLI